MNRRFKIELEEVDLGIYDYFELLHLYLRVPYKSCFNKTKYKYVIIASADVLTIRRLNVPFNQKDVFNYLYNEYKCKKFKNGYLNKLRNG